MPSIELLLEEKCWRCNGYGWVDHDEDWNPLKTSMKCPKADCQDGQAPTKFGAEVLDFVQKRLDTERKGW